MLLVRSHVVAAFLSPLVLLLAHDAAAQSAPPELPGPERLPTATFDSPDQVVFLPDGRFLVVEVSGRVWMILANRTQLPTPFLDIYLEVAGFSDLGMLGVAIDPDFATNPNRHWVYFGYTVDPNGDDVDNDPDHFVRVTRCKVSASDPNVADLSTRQVLIGATWTTGIVTTHTSHTVGALRFAADKTLLVACGEGAHHEVPADSGGMDPGAFGPGKTDPSENIGAFRARWLNAMGGKILRIDRDTGPGSARIRSGMGTRTRSAHASTCTASGTRSASRSGPAWEHECGGGQSRRPLHRRRAWTPTRSWTSPPRPEELRLAVLRGRAGAAGLPGRGPHGHRQARTCCAPLRRTPRARTPDVAGHLVASQQRG